MLIKTGRFLIVNGKITVATVADIVAGRCICVHRGALRCINFYACLPFMLFF